MRPRLDARDSVKEGTLFVRELESDLEFGDGERLMCNRPRKDGWNLKAPDDVSWEAAPTWSVKRRETGSLDGANIFRAAGAQIVT